MDKQILTSGETIDQEQVITVTMNVLEGVPGTDEATLYKFLELTQVTHRVCPITPGRLREIKMIMTNHLPHTHHYSLEVVLTRLGIDE